MEGNRILMLYCSTTLHRGIESEISSLYNKEVVIRNRLNRSMYSQCTHTFMSRTFTKSTFSPCSFTYYKHETEAFLWHFPLKELNTFRLNLGLQKVFC